MAVSCKLERSCYDDGKCYYVGALERCPNAYMTNADRIRSMSDEELAKFFHHQVGIGRDFVPCGVVCYGERNCPCYTKEECLTKIAKWLQQPAEEDDNG